MLKRTRRIGIFTTGLTLAWIWLLATSCQLNSYQGKIVVVQAPADESESGSHFALLDPAKEKVQPLLDEDAFFMVGSPDVSFDGEKLLFEAKQKFAGRAVSSSGSSSSTGSSSVTASSASSASGSYITYTVRQGDTLWEIAQKYPGTSESDIARLNNMTNSSRIQPGQVIRIKPKG